MTSLYFTWQADWVVMNYVPLAEGVLQIIVQLYDTTATYTSVINNNVLLHIIQVCTTRAKCL